MKDFYSKPELELVYLGIIDTISTSDPDSGGGSGGEEDRTEVER